MQRAVICVGLALASCKGVKKEEAGGAAAGSGSAAMPTASASKLSVMRDGAAIPSTVALVKSQPDGKIQLYVGDAGTCEQLLTNVFDGKNKYALIDIHTLLAADGTESYAIGDVYGSGAPETAEAGGKATVAGSLDKGSKLDINLDFTAKAAKLEVKGSVTAESCGPQDVSKGPLPKAQHASTAVMTIANKAYPIKAALLKGENIELTDFPRDCSSAWFIGARLEKDSSWHISGRRFATKVDGAGEGLTVTQGDKGTSDDGPTVKLTVGGSGKIGDYPVKLEGTIEALACP